MSDELCPTEHWSLGESLARLIDAMARAPDKDALRKGMEAIQWQLELEVNPERKPGHPRYAAESHAVATCRLRADAQPALILIIKAIGMPTRITPDGRMCWVWRTKEEPNAV